MSRFLPPALSSDWTWTDTYHYWRGVTTDLWYEYFMHIMYLLWKRWSRVGSLWDGSLGRKVIVRRVHDQLSQLQHQDFQHRCAIFLKMLWVCGSFSSASFWRRSKIYCHEGETLFLGLISGLKVRQGVGFLGKSQKCNLSSMRTSLMLIIQMWKGISNKQYRLSRGYVKTKASQEINIKVERN